MKNKKPGEYFGEYLSQLLSLFFIFIWKITVQKISKIYKRTLPAVM